MRSGKFSISAIFLLTLAATALAQQQPAQPQPRITPPGVKALRDIPYVKDGGERRTLDLYLPEKANKPLPLIIWVHGGAWKQGSKDRCPALPMVARGYAVASINYR